VATLFPARGHHHERLGHFPDEAKIRRFLGTVPRAEQKIGSDLARCVIRPGIGPAIHVLCSPTKVRP